MVGLRHLATRSAPMAMKSLENMSMKPFGCISLMSAPAAKALSLPVSTMQPIPSSASRSSMAEEISRNTPKDSAFNIFGRLSLRIPTAPLLSTMMCSNVPMGYPQIGVASECARYAGSLQGQRTTPGRRGAARPGGLGHTPLNHEHACGGGDRQQCADTDEDLADQRCVFPDRVFAAAGRDTRAWR